MPASCSAFGCTNRFKPGGPLQFFGFPLKHEALLKSWLVNMRRKAFIPTKASKICSAHFTEQDYLLRPGIYIRRLKPNAIPSIFSAFPEHLKPKQTSRRVLKKILDENIVHKEIESSTKNMASSMTSSLKPLQSLDFHEHTVVLDKIDKEAQTEQDFVEKKLKRKIKTFITTSSLQPLQSLDFHEHTVVLDKIDKEAQTEQDFVEKKLKRKIKTFITTSSLQPLQSLDFHEQTVVVDKIDKETQTEQDFVERKLKRQIKTLQQQVRRQNTSIQNLKAVLKILKKKHGLLMHNFEDTPLEMFKNESKNCGKHAKGVKAATHSTSTSTASSYLKRYLLHPERHIYHL